MSVTQETTDLLKEKLKETFGFSQFRGEQEDIIKNTLSGENTFVIMPTGAGKSLCYQMPAIAMEGTAIVISPLIALMKNQVDQMNAFGINAQFLNSSLNRAEMTKVKNAVIKGEVKLLYIAPESLTKEDNLTFLKQANISFVAIDEAHCISEWGHDFRPEYRRIRSIVESMDKALPIIALTATATPKVQQDIQKNLNLDDARLFKSSFNRKNLYYEIRAKRDDIDKQIIKYIKVNHGKSGIIYCLSRKKVEEIANLLNVNGVKALPYHAGLDSDVRMANQEAFLNEETEVMVATIAFGMGIDKPDVRFVIHYDAPKSLEGYYQETGRAGRDGLEGTCIMFYAKEDINKLDKFNKDKTIVERDTARMLLHEMVHYANLGTCRRRQLLNYFGEHMDKDCGFCDNCNKPTPKYKIEEAVVLALQTVELTGESFDAQHIADILMGYKSQFVGSNDHQKIATFGKAKSYFKLNSDDEEDDDDDDDDEVEFSDEEDEDGNPIPKAKAKKAPKSSKSRKNAEPEPIEQCVSMVRQIAVLGFLEKDVENYGILKLSEKGRSYMKDPFPLTLSKDHDYENEKIEEDEEKEAAGGSGSYDVALFELLKNLRKKLAKDKNLPPYVIFQDPSLEEMATTYPTTKDDMANINGVGMGKVVKFGRQFIDLIKKYVEDNEIETASEVVVKSAVNKSKIKIHIIQQVDRKVDLDIIADQKELAMAELIEEIEHICYSGTKLNLDYYINQVIEPDKQDEIFDYFMAAESDNIAVAMDECDIEDITEEELRLMRIKFLSEVAN
ncbi:ATP-dependent DNA helicase RecQ [Arcicella sp. LKC2W]|uniref:RecQ family ATP-dependent DNA helicase n=1 Tax=Arcicella sp. LKC2W TaxID=2984198 RepID=UPI002B1FC20E|nr:ATP-dependent DNA helicase RecQ [Arcicella sp. LKC2W]MEA5458334.1 ATP-dependent DNA helicase RecQ [Arcicella sp. LKC2W]